MTKEKLTLIKAGGKILDSEKEVSKLLQLVTSVPGRKILVHGGGLFIDELCQKLNIPTQMVNGRRITSPENMEVVLMTCAGKLNKQLVTELNKLGTTAIGLCGGDLNIICSKKRNPEPINFGMVGDITEIHTEWLELFTSKKVVPVISSITQSADFELLNTNADTIAAHLATALSKKFEVALFFYFDKSGVLNDPLIEDSFIPKLTKSRFNAMLNSKSVHSGIIPKLQNGFFALENGVKHVRMGNHFKNNTRLVIK